MRARYFSGSAPGPFPGRARVKRGRGVADAMTAPARLLVTVPAEPTRALLERVVPRIAIDYVQPEARGPWPEVEAMLVGTLERELPGFEASQTPRLRFVQRLFTGLDEFPFERLPEHVAVAGNVGAYAPFVAEHAVLLTLALLHDLEDSRAMVRAGRLRPPPPSRSLVGRTALLLGFGEIARELSTRFRALGMRVEGVSRTGTPSEGAATMYPADRLLEALSGATVVVDCRPLTNRTRGTINSAAFARMREDAVFVNVGRAGTVEEEALYRHLTAHPGFRAGTDVWWTEEFVSGRLTTRFPFADLPNFLGTPHVAGIGKDARDRATERAAANLARFFSGATPLHLVDRTEYRRA